MLQSRSIVAGVALVVAVAGCRDTAAPDKAFTVTASIDAPPQGIFGDTPNGPIITCSVPITLQAQGTGGARGTWTGATEFWFYGLDRTNVTATTTNPASDLQQAFGASTIAAGETKHAIWTFHFGAPFEATMRFEYTLPDGQTTGNTSVHFTCGPSVQASVAPTVTAVSTPSTTGELEVGDTVSVSLAETGSSGIWETIVDASGAFISEQRFGEHMVSSVNRTVSFIVPATVNPGVPLTLTVRALNAALVSGFKSLETQREYVDRIPPTLLSANTDVRSASATGSGLAGQFAVGDKFQLLASAQDNIALGWLIYEIGPPANVIDSVPATPHATSMNFLTPITVGPGWFGPALLKVYARDAGGLTSNVLTSPTDSVRFYPVVSRPTTTPLQLSPSHETKDIVYDAKRDLMYVAIATDPNIAVFSPSSMTLQTPITLPAAPGGMDLSLSGDSLLVAVPSTKSIAVVDLTHPSAPAAMIPLPVVDTAGVVAGMGDQTPMPEDVRIMSNGKLFVFLSWGTRNDDVVVEVDLKTGAQKIRTDAPRTSATSTNWTYSVERSGDRSRLFVVNSARYDAGTDTWTTITDLLGSAFGVTTNTTGTQLTMTNLILDANFGTLWTADASMQGTTVLGMSSDGVMVYIGAGRSLTMMRNADKVLLERTPLPTNAERVFAVPGGRFVLVFENSSGAKVTRVSYE